MGFRIAHITLCTMACMMICQASAEKRFDVAFDTVPHADTGKLRARRPQEIVFLLDVSNSMAQGKKMDLLRGSMQVLLEKLRPVDRVSLISFGNDVLLLYRTTTFSKPDSLMRIIGAVRSKATATNVNGAIDMAYEQLSATPSGTTRQEVFLVTDGEFELSKRIVALVKKDSSIRLTAVIVGEGSAAAKAALAVRKSLELDVVTLVEEKRDAHNLLDHIEALTGEPLKQ
jgi:uncharacterized protein with von Willebrand factor type A (vWA) domain